jgi:hypothetical protein
METVLLLRPTLLTVAIRREILSVLARTDATTVPTATAHVAAIWTARRQRLGESPSAVGTAEALVCQVGADLLDELAGAQGTEEPASIPHPGRADVDPDRSEQPFSRRVRSGQGWAPSSTHPRKEA